MTLHPSHLQYSKQRSIRVRWLTYYLRCCVKMGLRKGLARIRGLRRALTDDEQQTVAKEIVEYLELCNWISPVRGEPPRSAVSGRSVTALDQGEEPQASRAMERVKDAFSWGCFGPLSGYPVDTWSKAFGRRNFSDKSLKILALPRGRKFAP